MRSITTLDLQYAHRFYGFKGEAQYLHGHTGVLTIEVEDSVNAGVNMVFPCNEIQKTAWAVLKNFDHALVLREDDPLLPAILDVYEKQGIKNGTPNNVMKGPAFKTDLATAYPECRLVVTKETMTVEGMIKIVYDLLKDKLNIVLMRLLRNLNRTYIRSAVLCVVLHLMKTAYVRNVVIKKPDFFKSTNNVLVHIFDNYMMFNYKIPYMHKVCG